MGFVASCPVWTWRGDFSGAEGQSLSGQGETPLPSLSAPSLLWGEDFGVGRVMFTSFVPALFVRDRRLGNARAGHGRSAPGGTSWNARAGQLGSYCRDRNAGAAVAQPHGVSGRGCGPPRVCPPPPWRDARAGQRFLQRRRRLSEGCQPNSAAHSQNMPSCRTPKMPKGASLWTRLKAWRRTSRTRTARVKATVLWHIDHHRGGNLDS